MPGRRVRSWRDTLINTVVSNATQDVSDLMSGLVETESEGVTVVRTLMCYSMYPASPGAVNGVQMVDVGIGVADREAFSASVLPDPNVAGDEPYANWLYRCCHAVMDSVDAFDHSPIEVSKDIRAQRKVGRGNLYISVHNTLAQGSSFQIRFTGIIRTLILLA